MEEEGSCFVILEGRRFEGWFARFVLYRKDWKGRRNRGIVILWRLLSRRLNQTVSIPFVVTKKKKEREKERGKNTLALLSRQPSPLCAHAPRWHALFVGGKDEERFVY